MVSFHGLCESDGSLVFCICFVCVVVKSSSRPCGYPQRESLVVKLPLTLRRLSKTNDNRRHREMPSFSTHRVRIVMIVIEGLALTTISA